RRVLNEQTMEKLYAMRRSTTADAGTRSSATRRSARCRWTSALRCGSTPSPGQPGPQGWSRRGACGSRPRASGTGRSGRRAGREGAPHEIVIAARLRSRTRTCVARTTSTEQAEKRVLNEQMMEKFYAMRLSAMTDARTAQQHDAKVGALLFDESIAM